MATIVYGSVADVAALARVWTRNGSFFDSDPLAVPPVTATNPSLTTVTNWLTSISSQMSLALANHWFDLNGIPDAATFKSTYPDAYNAIAQQVVSLVSDLVDSANSSGRLTSDKLIASGKSQQKILDQEIDAWVNAYQDGLAFMSLPQSLKTSQKKQARLFTINSDTN